MYIPSIAVITNPNNLNEFKVLAREAGYEIVDIVKVRRLLSSGLSDVKLAELRSKLLAKGARSILFDVELKPKQTYNIAKSLKIVPKDRIEIILEIFKKHSPSKEADLQIKLASLQYELTKAREKVKLAKMGEQPGFYGLGEYEVDVYYDEIKKRIQNIKRKLEEIRKKRELHRIKRMKKGYKTIAITGYTCSGKSSLFNALSNSNVKTGSEPFTTLSTKFSLLKIGPWSCYLVDTIGFIRDLPPFLISAFHSTLEEVSFADLLLLVLDVSESYPEILRKLRESLKIISEIGYKGENIIVVLNKIDLISDSYLTYVKSQLSEELKEYKYPIVEISALYKINIDKLIKLIVKTLGEICKYKITIPYMEKLNNVFEFLKKVSMVEKVEYSNNNVYLHGCLPIEYLDSVKRYISKFKGRVNVERNLDIEIIS